MKKLIILVILLCGISAQAQNYWETANKTFANSDSVGTLDTLIRMDNATLNRMDAVFKYWYQFILVPDSTIQISTSSVFNADSTMTIKIGESYTSPRYAPDVVNWYLRMTGTGKAIVRKQLFGY